LKNGYLDAKTNTIANDLFTFAEESRIANFHFVEMEAGCASKTVLLEVECGAVLLRDGAIGVAALEQAYAK
jgi:hypothetical protein